MSYENYLAQRNPVLEVKQANEYLNRIFVVAQIIEQGKFEREQLVQPTQDLHTETLEENCLVV